MRFRSFPTRIAASCSRRAIRPRAPGVRRSSARKAPCRSPRWSTPRWPGWPWRSSDFRARIRAMSPIEQILGEDAARLLQHQCKTIPKESLHLPGPDYVDRGYGLSDRPTRVLTSLQALIGHGRLAGTGYVSILPVDQGIEHSAGAPFAPNPEYFDPGKIVELAVAGGCNGVASTFGVLAAVSRHWAHRIPFIVKLNHNELLTYPNKFDQIMFGTVKEAWNLGAVAVGATI